MLQSDKSTVFYACAKEQGFEVLEAFCWWARFFHFIHSFDAMGLQKNLLTGIFAYDLNRLLDGIKKQDQGLLEQNDKLSVSQTVNLAGVAIGDGLTDPVTQVPTHAANAYYVGLINERQQNELEKAQLEAVGLTKMENWSEATDARKRLFQMLKNMTELPTLYDYTRKAPYEDYLVAEFLNFSEAKKALGVNE